jgi:hypothetical protein
MTAGPCCCASSVTAASEPRVDQHSIISSMMLGRATVGLHAVCSACLQCV